MQAQGQFYDTNLTLIFFSCMIIACNLLYKAAVEYSYGEAADVSISARVQAVLRSEHQKTLRLTTGIYVTQYLAQCNGKKTISEVSSLRCD